MTSKEQRTSLTLLMSLARFTLVMIVGCVLLMIMVAASISFGAADMSLAQVWAALLDFDPSLTEHQIIQTLRVPRTAADLIVGCSLAVCGALMQGTTRNPLADSGLMGISAGAIFAIALCMVFLPGAPYWQTMLAACLGAALATGMTYGIASMGKRGMTPQRLVLAGISISVLFGAICQYLAIRYHLGHALIYWTAGSTAGVKWEEILIVVPFFVIGVFAALIISPSVTVLSLGEETATGLGLRTGFVKALSTGIVLILTGISVIVVGPIGFVGLIVPHIMRFLVGVDYRVIIPASALYGALLTVSADLAGRLINRPYETPIGIVLAVLGVPFFLYLVRRQKREFE